MLTLCPFVLWIQATTIDSDLKIGLPSGLYSLVYFPRILDKRLEILRNIVGGRLWFNWANEISRNYTELHPLTQLPLLRYFQSPGAITRLPSELSLLNLLLDGKQGGLETSATLQFISPLPFSPSLLLLHHHHHGSRTSTTSHYLHTTSW